MKFNDFLSQAWSDHAESSPEVARKLPDALAWIQESAQISSLAQLIMHVYGEHLGSWEAGLALLKTLSMHEMIDPESANAIERSIATLRLAQSDQQMPSGFSHSDQARILATASAMRVAHGQVDSAVRMLNAAEALSEDLPKDDPAHRALAVTGNNLASALEEKANRTSRETEAMVMAAEIALEKWQLAGNWNQVQMAYYRMAKSLIQAGDFVEALDFAEVCLQVAQENKGGAADLFWAYECLASGEIARGDIAHFHAQFEAALGQFEKMKPEDQKWAKPDLEKLRQRVPLN